MAALGVVLGVQIGMAGDDDRRDEPMDQTPPPESPKPSQPAKQESTASTKKSQPDSQVMIPNIK